MDARNVIVIDNCKNHLHRKYVTQSETMYASSRESVIGVSNRVRFKKSIKNGFYLTNNHGNRSVKCSPPYTTFLYSDVGIYRDLQGYTLFYHFCSKTYIVGTR